MENVFHKYQKEQEAQFREVHEDVRRNVQGRKGLWAMIGDVVDLYLPKILATLMGGASTSQSNGFISSSDLASDDPDLVLEE